MERMYLIKYSEIGIKGKNRHIFEDMLVRNIKSALRVLSHPYAVRKADGRIYVTSDESEAVETIDAITKVFGVAGICPVTQHEKCGFEALKGHVLEYIEKTYEEKNFTFKVNSRRADKSYPITSVDINKLLGEVVLDAFPETRVDVHKPQVSLQVEVRPADINIYSEMIPGPRGMPVGSSGCAMLLLSGGIDSPVAGYIIAKRGVGIDAVYFHAPPYTSERAKQKVVDLARIIARYSGPMRLHIVNFTDIQMKIYRTCPHDELTIIMRRFMMRIAEHFADERGALGLVTGESIGQVASQTLQSIFVVNEVCKLPVYRPLCGFDKLDIVEVSKEIGTYETSILPYEDCCTVFVAKHPVTKPRLDRILRSEKKLEGQIEEMYRKAIETVEIINI
ncbi:MAG: tRNA uracil 4-sulfurtransferase ThiI [Lachnospiraceae bacterium]